MFKGAVYRERGCLVLREGIDRFSPSLFFHVSVSPASLFSCSRGAMNRIIGFCPRRRARGPRSPPPERRPPVSAQSPPCL